MSTELRMLAWTAGLTLVLWLPYILARMMSYGLVPTVTYAADAKSLPGWAERAKRAHYNAVENLAPFAVVVLVAHLAQVTNATTAAAAVVYFWARVVHYLGQISGVPFVRTIAFGVGWAATMVIFLVIVT